MERLVGDTNLPIIPLVLLAALSSNVKPGAVAALSSLPAHRLPIPRPWIYWVIPCAIAHGLVLSAAYRKH